MLDSLWQTKLYPLFNDHSYLVSFAVIAALMGAGQLFNQLRLRSASASPTNHKVKIIIASWWKIMVFVFFSFWGGRYTMIPTFYLLTIFAIREYVGISLLKDNTKPLILGGTIGATIHYASFFMPGTLLFFTSFHFYILLVLMPFLVFTSRPERMAELIAFYLGVMILIVFLSFPVAVVVFQSDWIGSEPAARLAVLLLITLTEVNDIAQFLCGKLFGRRKVVPWVSPNKTEAGFIGGLLLSTLIGAVIWPYFLPISIPAAALLGFILSVGGMLGDLVCSALKRFRGVKDFSDFIPGHGGTIDRLDSLLVTGPLFFFFLYIHRKLFG
ncbi:MAG: phosphatidate cytidylyltransferase [Bdellovibrionota bacterium]